MSLPPATFGQLIEGEQRKKPAVDDHERAKWKWKCSKETKMLFESVGLYDDMEDIARDLHFAATNQQIYLATNKVKAIKEFVAATKISFDLWKGSGAQDDDRGVSEITISMAREEPAEKSEPEKDK